MLLSKVSRRSFERRGGTIRARFLTYQLLSWGAHCRQPLPPYSSVKGELLLRVRSPPHKYPRNFPPVLEAVLRAAAVATPPICTSNLPAVIPQEYFQSGWQPPSFQLVSLSFSTLCFPLFCPCGYLLKPPSAWRAGLLMFCHQSLMFSSSSIFKGKVMINGWLASTR